MHSIIIIVSEFTLDQFNSENSPWMSMNCKRRVENPTPNYMHICRPSIQSNSSHYKELWFYHQQVTTSWNKFQNGLPAVINQREIEPRFKELVTLKKWQQLVLVCVETGLIFPYSVGIDEWPEMIGTWWWHHSLNALLSNSRESVPHSLFRHDLWSLGKKM